jgi:hypothetical protein
MFRAIAICVLAAATAGCAGTQRTTSGGYYCKGATQDPCPEHEVSPDCQLCPRSSESATH